MRKPVTQICDIRNPETGKTYREENAEMRHRIPIGTLVQINNGARAFVIKHNRDCDQTPLYALSLDKRDIELLREGHAVLGMGGGYPEESLIVVEY